VAAGGKSAKKRIRLVAAIAACLAVFVFVCGCGYLPSITVILQTLFASGVGKDVEVHEVTYTYQGTVKQYDDISNLLEDNELDILIPHFLPDGSYITNVLLNDDGNIFILLNDSSFTFQIFMNKKLTEFVEISNCEIYDGVNGIIYIRKVSDSSYIAYIEDESNVYCLQNTDNKLLIKIMENMR